jgi:hypothetical protein
MPIGDSHELCDVWRDQDDEEEGTVQIKTEPEDFAQRARSLERQHALLGWSALIVASAISIVALHNVYAAEQPWIRLGQAWMVVVVFYIFVTEFQRRVVKGSDEPCAYFLERQHEERAKSYLRVRRIVPLLVPSIAATWLGGGPLIAAKARGLNPSSWLFQFCAGPAPFIIFGACLVFVWWAFGFSAKKAYRERDEIRRRITG